MSSLHYRYGGEGQSYAWNWRGLPMYPTRAAESRELAGSDDPELGDYINVTATYQKTLGDYPVAMSLQSGRQSVLHSGPEQTHIHDGLGIFEGYSIAKKVALVAGVGGAAYLAWKLLGKKGRRR